MPTNTGGRSASANATLISVANCSARAAISLRVTSTDHGAFDAGRGAPGHHHENRGRSVATLTLPFRVRAILLSVGS